MKYNSLRMGVLLGLATFLVFLGVSVVTFAQTNDQVVADVLGTSSRGYVPADKDLVKVISTTATTATIQAPIAKKDGKNITGYYITWAPISYKDITASSNKDDLDKVKDSDTAALISGALPIYKIEGNNLIITIEVTDPTKDVYMSIMPEDSNKMQGGLIEDFKFNLSTSSTTVAGDVYSTTSKQAIGNVTCVWDATANRTTLLWDINTAMNASKIEISHSPDETPGSMAVKGTPNATERRFAIDTPNRNFQVFKLKPLDANGAMLGIEIMYTCKASSGSLGAAGNSGTQLTPTDPKKPIPVTPHTGPLETTAILFFVSLVGYFIYRKVKA